ncbi:hypothetical protein DEU44_1107 [Priestia megaterium]|nr:hypothetical protein DEU44_1107 [Priestia megaterium]
MQQIDIQEKKDRQSSLSMYFLHIYLKTKDRTLAHN